MAKPGQHPSMADQLNELISVIEDADAETGPNAKQVADKGRHILALAQELARDIGTLTRGSASQAYQRVRQTAEQEVDAMAQCVRDRPLASVAIAGAVGATLVCLMSRSHRRHDY